MSVPSARHTVNDFNNFYSFLLLAWQQEAVASGGNTIANLTAWNYKARFDCQSLNGPQYCASAQKAARSVARNTGRSLAAAWFIRESVLYESTDDARIDGEIMPLSARINGHVQQLNVIEGQMVHAGDVLAVLDQKEYSIAVYQATANLTYAVNTAASLYYSAAITVTTAYGDLSSAQAAVKSAQAEVAAAENKLRADEAVLKQVQANEAQLTIVQAVVAADQQVLLETQKELVQAAGHLRDAQTAPQQASLAKVRAEAADSQVLQCKAQLERAQLNLNNTIIRSPATGIVGKRRIEVGQNVKVGQDLIDIVSLDDVWITATFHAEPACPPEAGAAGRNQGGCL